MDERDGASLERFDEADEGHDENGADQQRQQSVLPEITLEEIPQTTVLQIKSKLK